MALILLVGALLRFARLDAAQYREDEYGVTGMVLDIVAGRRFPTGFPGSAGVEHGPLSTTLLALPGLLSESPVVLDLVGAAINTAAILAMYSLTRAMLGTRAGLIAAAMLAFNPWVVVTGRRLWTNQMIVPAAVFFLWALHRALTANRPTAWVLAGTAISASMQTHLSSMLNPVAILAGLAPFARGVSRRGVVLATVIAGLLLLPYLVGSLLPGVMTRDTGSLVSSGSSWNPEIFARASLSLTGLGYEAVAAQAARVLDAKAPLFVAADGLARILGAAGWMCLLWIAWQQRQRALPTAAACLVGAAMAALPILSLLRPPESTALVLPGPHHLLNVLPPLIVGTAALTRILPGLLGSAAAWSASAVALTHLVLALPFFATIDEYWPTADYGVPWHYTEGLVAQTLELAKDSQAAILVGGDGASEHQWIVARLLRRHHQPVRMHDARDGLAYPANATLLLLVSSDNEHTLARFLRQEFPSHELVKQDLAGFGWSRSIFQITPNDLDKWAVDRLAPLPPAPADPRTPLYARAAVLPPFYGSNRTVLGVQWRFQTEPLEGFFTEVVLQAGGQTVHREQHLAFPAAFLEPGDWTTLTMLNLFELPPDVDLRAVDELVLIHNGVRTGRDVAPSVRFPLPVQAALGIDRSGTPPKDT